jgi:hypothetical protein
MRHDTLSIFSMLCLGRLNRPRAGAARCEPSIVLCLARGNCVVSDRVHASAAHTVDMYRYDSRSKWNNRGMGAKCVWIN